MEQIVVDNRYALSRPLGGGGMAKVYLAHDEVLDRDVAIKLLREQFAGDEEFVERFKREAQSAAALSHPHIVQIYDRGRSEGGEYYIAMEYVPGGTLKDRLVGAGRLDPDEAAGVAEQVADALSAAHEKGVVHRDIKPQNVLVTRSGDVKVADFGIARAASSSVTTTSAVMGTAGYMSPEQARGETVGPASDLYSLGVVLYEMLTGNLPYEAESPMALAMRHVSEPARSPREDNPEVPEALDAITTRLLAKSPEARYPSADALANDLERIQSGRAPAVVDAEKTQLMTAPLPPLPRREAQTARTAVRRSNGPAPPPYGYAGGRVRRRGRLFPALLALLFAVALLAGVAFALTRDFDLPFFDQPAQQQTPQVSVPDVTGMGRDQAIAELRAAGLEADPRDRESDFQQQGVVLDQDPASGARLDEGEAVKIYVGSGPSSVTVPDLLYGSTAEADLFNAGLGLGNYTEAPSGTVPAGQVIETNPAEGATVEPNSLVDVVVSTGPAQQYQPPPTPSGPVQSGGDAFQEPAPFQNGNGGGNRGNGGGEGGEGNGNGGSNTGGGNRGNGGGEGGED